MVGKVQRNFSFIMKEATKGYSESEVASEHKLKLSFSLEVSHLSLCFSLRLPNSRFLPRQTLGSIMDEMAQVTEQE